MSASELRTGLGLQIVKLRKGRGWSQQELAKRLGVDRSCLGKWERGLNAPALEDLTALAALLGVTLDELVHGRGTPSPLPAVQREQLTKLLNGLVRVLGPLTGRTPRDKQRSLSGAATAPVSTTQGGQR